MIIMNLGTNMNIEKNLKQRAYREKTGNAATKKYERTKNGKLMRIYRNMQSRIAGIQKNKHHLYAGKDILTKDAFYEWAKSSQDFDELYAAWVDSGYAQKEAPSVDRINPALGYCESNMQWVTHSENSRRGALSRFSRRGQS